MDIVVPCPQRSVWGREAVNCDLVFVPSFSWSAIDGIDVLWVVHVQDIWSDPYDRTIYFVHSLDFPNKLTALDDIVIKLV